jgi:hypothetical protein
MALFWLHYSSYQVSCHNNKMDHKGTVCVSTRLWVVQLRNWALIPSRGLNISHVHGVHISSGSHPIFSPMDTRHFFLKNKAV